ncbi:MAG: hypothetical protein IJZ66_02790, partial [Oscillibacter sp.]|nr:hypothetical protein [Oscillibacter sp.]
TPVTPEPPVEPEGPEEPEVPAEPETPPLPSVVFALEEVDLTPVTIIQNPLRDDRPLYAALQGLQSIQAQVRRGDGTEETVTLPLDWAAANAAEVPTDTSAVGTYLEVAAVLLPDETYVFGEDVPTTIALPVEVIIPDVPYVITSCADPAGYSAVCALPMGTDLEELISDQPSIWECYEEDGTAHPTTISWDGSAVDVTTPGLYTLTGTLEVPMHGVFAESLALPPMEVTVSVQDPGEPDINCFYAASATFRLPWVVERTARAQAFLSEDGGDFVPVGAEQGITLNRECLTLRPKFLTPGTIYRLQVDFQDCSTGLLTFFYDGKTLQLLDYDASDRLDYDREEDEDEEDDSPSVSKPAIRPDQPEEPAAPEEPAPVPSAPSVPEEPQQPQLQENEILGVDLLTLIAEGEAEFSTDCVVARFSRSSLQGMDIEEDDIFSVLLKNEGDGSFSIAVTRNGEFVEDFHDLQIVLPYETATLSPILTLLDEQGYPVADGTYDPSQKAVSFTIHRTGRYTIAEEQLAETPEVPPAAVSSPATKTPVSTLPTTVELPAPSGVPLYLYAIPLAFLLAAAALFVLYKAKIK